MSTPGPTTLQNTTAATSEPAEVEEWDFLDAKKLRKAAGAPCKAPAPPHNWRETRERVLAWFALTSDEQKDEQLLWKNMSRSERQTWSNKVPGYQARSTRRSNRPVTRTTRGDGRTRRQAAAQEQGDDDMDCCGLADTATTRAKKGKQIGNQKKPRRKASDMAKTERQRFDSKVRRKRAVVAKHVAELAYMTTGGSKDLQNGNIKVAFTMEVRTSDSNPNGGRPPAKKGSARNKIQFIAMGHRLNNRKNLENHANAIMKAAKNKDDEYDLLLWGQQSRNDLREDIKVELSKLEAGRSRPRSDPMTEAEALQNVANAAGTSVPHTPIRLQRSRRSADI